MDNDKYSEKLGEKLEEAANIVVSEVVSEGLQTVEAAMNRNRHKRGRA